MTSPLFNLRPDLFLQVSVWRPIPGEVRGQVYSTLPGMETYKKDYYASTGQLEETSAMYDDVSHELKCWKQLLELALEDILFKTSPTR